MNRQGNRCPMPHDIANNRPKLGVSLLVPSQTPRPLTELLGVNDQELLEQMARGHPYAFNLGSGKSISYQNYKEAAKALMERNLPEVLHNKQTKVVFVPQAHLPKMPRVVDLNEYMAKKESFTEKALSFLGIKKGTEDISNALGDIAENNLAEELQQFFAKSKNVVVLQGGTFRVPGKGKRAIEEHDFVIIDMEYKLIVSIESKVTLTGSTGHSAVEQIKKLQKLLEEYFASELTSSEWCFVPIIFTSKARASCPPS